MVSINCSVPLIDIITNPRSTTHGQDQSETRSFLMSLHRFVAVAASETLGDLEVALRVLRRSTMQNGTSALEKLFPSD